MANKPELPLHDARGSAGFGLGAVCVLVSLVLHSVFAPLPSLSARLKPHARAAPPVARAAFSEIPVDLSDSADEERAPMTATAKDVEPPVVPRAVSNDPEGLAAPAPDAAAKPRAAHSERAPSQSASSAPHTGAHSQGSGPRLDVTPRASSNSSHVLGSSVVNDCSLSVLLDIGRVRTHPRAAQLSALLAEWQPLFAEPGFDPLSDVDRLLLVGPELRPSGRGLAVVQHHLDPTQVQNSLARVAARATPTDPKEEHFYLQLSPDLLLMAPDRGSLRPVKGLALTALPEESIGTLYVDAPSRALAELALEIPPSIHWLRGIISLVADNGVAVDIEAGDESNELGKRHARQLTQSVRLLKIKGHARAIERARFEAREGESVIVGRLEITSLQLSALLEALSERVNAPPELPPPPDPAASTDDPSEPPAPVIEAAPVTDTPIVDAGQSAADATTAIDSGK